MKLYNNVTYDIKIQNKINTHSTDRKTAQKIVVCFLFRRGSIKLYG